VPGGVFVDLAHIEDVRIFAVDQLGGLARETLFPDGRMMSGMSKATPLTTTSAISKIF
jgi:hypothetical protein